MITISWRWSKIKLIQHIRLVTCTWSRTVVNPMKPHFHQLQTSSVLEHVHGVSHGVTVFTFFCSWLLQSFFFFRGFFLHSVGARCISRSDCKHCCADWLVVKLQHAHNMMGWWGCHKKVILHLLSSAGPWCLTCTGNRSLWKGRGQAGISGGCTEAHPHGNLKCRPSTCSVAFQKRVMKDVLQSQHLVTYHQRLEWGTFFPFSVQPIQWWSSQVLHMQQM